MSADISAKASLPSVGVILPAGGKGLRVGGSEPKQFLPLRPGSLDKGPGSVQSAEDPKAMLLYTLEAFHKLDFVKSIVLVLPPERLAEYESRLSAFSKVKLVEGGAERWESVRNGFEAMEPNLSYVMIHDVARPFVTEAIIRRCLSAVTPTSCVIAALPASDTVKQIAESVITATLERRNLILVQTPQVFPREILTKVYSAPQTGDMPTDEAQMAERAGFEVRWVRGGESNRKVTGAEDLVWANWMAGRFESGETFFDLANG